MLVKPLMAQAFADEIGATKRQVQFWTDRGAIKCIPETDQQGRGKQRHYDEAEIPIARIIAQTGAAQLPIGRLIWSADEIRGKLEHGDGLAGPPGRPASWYRAALAGKHKSFICLRVSIQNFAWFDETDKDRFTDRIAGFVIPVHEVSKRVSR